VAEFAKGGPVRGVEGAHARRYRVWGGLGKIAAWDEAWIAAFAGRYRRASRAVTGMQRVGLTAGADWESLELPGCLQSAG